jgi:hypothetical protein
MRYLLPLAALLLNACVVTPSGPYVVAPALPVVVDLGTDPYYYHGGFYYYYHGDRWSYSRSRSGPWQDLPRDRYPHETRFRGRGDHRDRDFRR